MAKTAFIFPGQGAQYVGMGKDFYDALPVCRQVYETAGKAGGLDVAALCFEENDRLNITEYTQIAMLATEVAMCRALIEKGVKPDVTAGLSLGEYGALAVSGVMSDEDLFRAIRQRGIFMQEAVPVGGAMTAVLGLDTDTIEKVCQETEGTVSIANYNCPGQTVITGEAEAVEAAAEKLAAAGAKRCVPLKVSGPFHSPMLAQAGTKLGQVLSGIAFSQSRVPYLANVTADYVHDGGEAKKLLEQQVASPVRWQQTVEHMIVDGVTVFVEIGPGKTLSGFMRKINRDVKMLSVEKLEDLDKVAQELLA